MPKGADWQGCGYMSNTEAKVLSAVLEDKQVHVLLQANISGLLRTHGDVWEFVRNYFENNSVVPPVSLVIEKFRDFDVLPDVGSTKYHLGELQVEYLNDSLKDVLRLAATEVQSGNGSEALENLIGQTAELKRTPLPLEILMLQIPPQPLPILRTFRGKTLLGTEELRRVFQDLITTSRQELCLDS